MPAPDENFHRSLKRAVAIISLDAEQIWGHLDLLNEQQFCERYPSALAAYDRLLGVLCSAGVSATWLVVGGMALAESDGPRDPRLLGLPARWTRSIPPGDEGIAALWYRRSFVKRLAEARPKQDVGLHGGLTHLIWTDWRSKPEVIRREFFGGIEALEAVRVRPVSFSFPRNQEACHGLLASNGILCYRGRPPVLSEKLGRTLPGSLLRILEELGRAKPPPVWPKETLPGLWNIPASLFLYPIGESRSRLVVLRSRIERVARGLDAAIRHNGVFHFCLHPVNLAESPKGFSVFEGILERILKARESGDIETLTMAELAARMAQEKGNGISAPALYTETLAPSPALSELCMNPSSGPEGAALTGKTGAPGPVNLHLEDEPRLQNLS